MQIIILKPLMLFHMQSSQQGFNIKWQHVSTTHPKS
jgi:hypothetical protein